MGIAHKLVQLGGQPLSLGEHAGQYKGRLPVPFNPKAWKFIERKLVGVGSFSLP